LVTALGRIARHIITPAVLAAALLSTVDIVRSSVEAALLVTALLLPLALAWALLATLLQPAVARLARVPSLAARILVGGEVGGLLLATGAYATDLLLRDWPFGPQSRLALALTVLQALGGVWLSGRLCTPVAQRFRDGQAVTLVGALLAGDGLGLALFDELGIGTEKHLHPRLFHASFALLTIGMVLVLWQRRSWLITAAGALVATVALVVALAPRDRVPLYDRVARSRGMHGRILTMARRLSDGDHDGFSGVLGGGDCDDGDPRAYPLSQERDCLGWRTGLPSKTPYLPEVRVKPAAPRLILLLTIDAFRCGFGVGAPSPLRDACPNLTRLAAQGWSRLDAHTSAPNTAASMTILMTGNPNADPIYERHRKRPTLALRLRQAGYHTEVLMTLHNILEDLATHDAFDEVNTELRSEPQSPFRGEALTELTLAHVRAALATKQQRTLLWAHYPDPHFPYTFGDEPWKRSTIEEYGRVVSHTDAVIGQLLDGVARLPEAGDVLVVVTADHGEEFAHEHGERFHGFTLYEPVVRVPIIAWSPVEHRRFLAAPPPATTAQLARYLLDAVGEPLTAPLPGGGDSVLLRTVTLDRQFGVIADGWKLIYNASRNTTELFDLSRDPSEQENLAGREAAKVYELGRLLGGMLSPRVFGRSAPQQLRSR
jgi:hypothetical protein